MRNIVKASIGFLILLWIVAPSFGADRVEKLYEITKGEVGNMKITDDGATSIRNILADGVKNSKATDAEMANGARKFGRALAGHARFDESSGTKVIDQSAVKAARGSVCPLYPIC